jgi:lysophospholipase L1-like esterase
MRHRRLALLVLPGLVALAAPSHADARARWTVSWATSQHATGADLTDQTVRMIVHLTQGGTAVRVRIGNTLGTTPLRLARATVAPRATGAGLRPGTVRALTFDGSSTVQVPPGQYVVSDPVDLVSAAQQDLAVSMYVPATSTPSVHATAFETSYLTAAGTGDHTADTAPDAFSTTTQSTYWVDAVDVLSKDVRGAVVVTGGSVVDGTGSDKTGPLGTGPAASPHSRWSDVLATRILREPGDQLTVAEAGIGGNTAARACGSSPYGNVQDRLDRDVLSLSNVTDLIVYAGTNDLGIGTGCDAPTIIAAFRDIIARAHAQGIRVLVSTVTPRAHYTPLQNEQRHLVNLWVTKWNRCGGECDGTAPFDAAVSWYAYPNALDPRYDSGDDIHPNAEGYALMGRSIDLGLLRG